MGGPRTSARPGLRSHLVAGLLVVLVVSFGATACSGPDESLPEDASLRAGLDAVLAEHPATTGRKVGERRYIDLDACPLGDLPLDRRTARAQLTYLQGGLHRIVCSDHDGGFVAITHADLGEFLARIEDEDGQLSEPRDSFGGEVYITVSAKECQALWVSPGSDFAFTSYLFEETFKPRCTSRLEKALPTMTAALVGLGS